MRFFQIIRNIILRICLLLIFVSFIKTEWLLVLFSQIHRVFFNFKSPHFISFCNWFISRNQHFRRDWIMSELMGDYHFFFYLFLCNHLFNFFLSYAFLLCFISHIKAKRFWDCYSIFAFFLSRKGSIVIYVVLCSQFWLPDIVFVKSFFIPFNRLSSFVFSFSKFVISFGSS